jgi:glutaryl-CoA dehydrogenase (non-decarboxylating)
MYFQFKGGSNMSIRNLELTARQKEKQEEFKAFVDLEIAPLAAQIDQEECMPKSVIQKLIDHGYWGAELPSEYGGADMDNITYGLFNEEIGRGCGNVRNMLGVQGMVASVILRWGTAEQKTQWLPRLASGELTAAFALTEPEIGSDAKNIHTAAKRVGGDYVINGRKKWITFGQNADLFLVFAHCDGKGSAFLVERNTPGFSSKPISGLFGFRGSMLAELNLEECRVPANHLVGRVGFGLSLVANHGLSQGRYSTAWGCVGLAQGCLNSCLDYASKRKQFETYLKEHQMIQQMIAEMVSNIMAAKLLCFRVGQLRDSGDQKAVLDTSVAKYFASTIAFKAANDAVQIHGANGCGSEYPVQRYLRDAKILEIVEGSTQIQQLLIARHAFSKLGD